MYSGGIQQVISFSYFKSIIYFPEIKKKNIYLNL